MEFEQALAGLQERGPGRMVADLSRITALAELLGDPQRAYPSVHVTGTNGKTSVTRMTATLLSAVGISAGTYTSPHLQSVRERFTVAGRMISEQRFAEAYEDVALLADHLDADLAAHGEVDRVTYFELLTAMAYWWFADLPVDVAVVEVGMGGTWDATNLVRGEVAVITPIDVDHRELGDRPEAIAREKAGIIKDGATVVLAEQTPAVLAVIEQAAAEHGATLRRAGTDHAVVSRTVAVGGQYVSLRVGDRVVDEIFLPLHGPHQADNAALALAALAALLGPSFEAVDDDLVRHGFAAVTAPGRLEVVNREPTVILDGAHNPHGARTAAAALDEAFDFRSLVVVLGCLADKDLEGIVAAWEGRAQHVVITAPPSPRAASVEELRAVAERVFAGSGVVVESAGTVAEALDLAAGVAGPGDGILVTGSLYAVGAARDVYLPVVAQPDEVIREPDYVEDEDQAFEQALDEMISRVDEERRRRQDG